jgi:hypothetical protein
MNLAVPVCVVLGEVPRAPRSTRGSRGWYFASRCAPQSQNEQAGFVRGWGVVEVIAGSAQSHTAQAGDVAVRYATADAWSASEQLDCGRQFFPEQSRGGVPNVYCIPSLAQAAGHALITLRRVGSAMLGVERLLQALA